MERSPALKTGRLISPMEHAGKTNVYTFKYRMILMQIQGLKAQFSGPKGLDGHFGPGPISLRDGKLAGFFPTRFVLTPSEPSAIVAVPRK